MVNQSFIKRIELAYLILVTAAATFMRVWFVLNVPTEQVFDFSTYQEIAVNVCKYGEHLWRGAAIAWQGPAYPLALGHFYRLAGDSDVLLGKFFNVTLSMLTLVMFFLLLRRLSQSRLFVYGAYTLAAFLPNFLAYNNVIGTEVFFTFLFTAILLLQLYPFKDWLRLPLLGLLIGVAALAKPFFLAYPLVAALYCWLRGKDLKRTLLVLTALLVLMTAVVAPWTYRNYRAYGEFIPVSYNSGYVLYINNNDLNVTGRWMDLQEVPAPPELEHEIAAILRRHDGQVQLAYELDPLLREAAQQWIRANPLDFMQLGLLRLGETYYMGAWDLRSWAMNELPSTSDPGEGAAYRRALSAFHAVSDMLVYILSTCGLLFMLVKIFPVVRAVFRRETVLPDLVLLPAINLAFFVLIVFAFEGQARYNFPLFPLHIIGLFAVIESLRQQDAGSERGSGDENDQFYNQR